MQEPEQLPPPEFHVHLLWPHHDAMKTAMTNAIRMHRAEARREAFLEASAIASRAEPQGVQLESFDKRSFDLAAGAIVEALHNLIEAEKNMATDS